MDIRNDDTKDLQNWSVKISGFQNAKIQDGWNAEFDIQGDTLTCTPVDYNQILTAGTVTNFGFQASFPTQEEADADRKAVVLIDGKAYEGKKKTEAPLTKGEKDSLRKEEVETEKGSPFANHGKLSVKGTDLTDEKGEPYQLKGVSTHGIAWFPQYVNEDAFKTLRDDWGANLIRIAMYTAENGGYCTDGNQTELKNLVEKGVDAASDLGMYVIIDWHILSDQNPLTNKDSARTFFDEMSARYADYGNVLYEICNEPNGGTSWQDIKSYAEEVIPVIRKNAPDAVILVGTPTWSQDVDVAAADPLTDVTNVMYTCHFYAATHKENIRDKVKKAHDMGLPVFISEFSICDASGNGSLDYDSASEWMKLINDENLSYAGWSLSNKNESSALISSGCDLTSGWTDADLSETGKWLKQTISGK